jgi:hypothetical protein
MSTSQAAVDVKGSEKSGKASARARALAERIEQGARELEAFAQGLSDADWKTPMVTGTDRRPVGLIVHHVGTMYPIEVDVAKAVARGEAVDVTWEAVADINGKHAAEHGAVTKSAAIDLLRKNSRAAAEAVRGFSDEELDRAAPFGLSYGAPMTAQFVVEDHALRHSWHHLARIRKALKR